MIDHTGVVVSDFERSKIFYSSALSSIGYSLLKEFPASITGSADVAGFGEPPKPDFWIVKSRPNNPVHVAFRVSSRAWLTLFIGLRLPREEKTTGLPACGRTTIPPTTGPSCSILTVITSKPFVMAPNDGQPRLSKERLVSAFLFVLFAGNGEH